MFFKKTELIEQMNLNFDQNNFSYSTKLLNTAFLNENDINNTHISSIRLEKCELLMTSPLNNSFNNLNTIYIYLETEELAPILVAKNNKISPNPGKFMIIYPSDENFKNYFKQKNIKLIVKSSSKTKDEIPYQIEINMVFQVISSSLSD